MEQTTPKGASFLKVTGILMIIGGGISLIVAIVALLGIAALAVLGASSGMLYAAGALTLISAVAELVAGIIGVVNAKRAEKAGLCMAWGIIVAVLCVAVLASCFVFALAASGSEQVGGGQWSWETIPGFRAKSAYMHPELFHGASAQVGAGEIVRKTATAGNTAVATAWGFLGTCRVWWNLPTQ